MVRFHEYEHHGPNRIKCQFEQCTCEYKKLTFVEATSSQSEGRQPAWIVSQATSRGSFSRRRQPAWIVSQATSASGGTGSQATSSQSEGRQPAVDHSAGGNQRSGRCGWQCWCGSFRGGSRVFGCVVPSGCTYVPMISVDG